MKTTNNLPKIISVFSFNNGNKNNNEASYFLGCNLFKRYSSKVLFVDCDWGLRLSSLFFGDGFNDYYQCQENSTIYDGLKPVIYSLPEKIKPFSCKRHIEDNNLFLIPGSERINDYADALNYSFSCEIPALRNIHGALYHLIIESAKNIGAEIVIVDLGKLRSFISMISFLMSDSIIITLKSDRFFNISTNMFADLFIDWKEKAFTLYEKSLLSCYPLPLKESKQFVGCLIENLTSENIRTIEDDLVPRLLSSGIIAHEEKFCIFSDITQLDYYGNK